MAAEGQTEMNWVASGKVKPATREEFEELVARYG